MAIAVFCCVLGFYWVPAQAQRTPTPAKPPFASSIEQRAESVNELKAIRTLLEEQNRLIKEQTDLLRSAFPNVTQPKKS
ncbi:MAG: hypothetical protein ACYC6Y_13075 [Thermoguttaceae bacterium]